MAPSRAVVPLRNICSACIKLQQRHQLHLYRQFYSSTPPRHSASDNLPRIAAPSFWSSLIPKPLRNLQKPSIYRPSEWNPFAIFIILGILVGSNAIQIISLRNETLSFSRKTEAKLSLLREVVQKVKNGEEVDVKRVLGTGDAMAEAEWEEMIKELERVDEMERGRKRRDEKKQEEARKREGSGGGGAAAAESASERRPKYLM